MPRHRSENRRGTAPAGVLVLMLVASVMMAMTPLGASAPDAESGVTIRAIVRHNDGVTRPSPGLEGVEVFVWDGSQAHYECTNSVGVARFENMPEGAGYIAATGPSYGSPRCSNGDFLNPFPGDDLGKQMYTVYWNRHKGVRQFDSFSVGDSAKQILFVTSTPPNQRRLCAGLTVTIEGTTGDDTGPTRIMGTEEGDVINALGGDDVVLGRGGDDFICGGPGKDTLYGEDGDDIIWGESGLDLLVGGAGYDTLYGGSQGDTCTTGETLISCED